MESSHEKEAVPSVFTAPVLEHGFVPVRSLVAGSAEEIARASAATSTNSAEQRSLFLGPCNVRGQTELNTDERVSCG